MIPAEFPTASPLASARYVVTHEKTGTTATMIVRQYGPGQEGLARVPVGATWHCMDDLRRQGWTQWKLQNESEVPQPQNGLCPDP